MAAKNEEKKLISVSGKQKLEEELNDRKVNQRKLIAQKIKEAREQGDLSENAEYDAAKDEQRDNEMRIQEIEKILKNVEVVDDNSINTDTIGLGTSVKIQEKKSRIKMEYVIVGTNEVDILNNKISNESPVGQALIGHKVGDEVKVEIPAGTKIYKVLEISRAEE